MSAVDVLERVPPAEPAPAGPAGAALVLVHPLPVVPESAVAVPVAQEPVAREPVAREPAPAPPAAPLESLVRAAAGGDGRARDRLLAEIHPFVLRYCRGRLGRQETVTASADDVAQEVCLAVINALPAYTVKGLSFRAFVYGIAAHKVTDAFRAIGRTRTEPVADLPDSPAGEDGPENRLLAAELGGRLSRLLEALTPRQRDVLVLRIMVGLSAEETAAAVGSTPGAVRVTQHRALNRLRSILEGGTALRADEPDEVMPALPAARQGSAR